MEKHYVLMIAESGRVTWMQADTDLEEVKSTMEEWMARPERCDEDFAWITEAVAFMPPAGHAEAA